MLHLKTGLIFLLFFHLINSFSININALNRFKGKEKINTSLNRFGKTIIDTFNPIKFPEGIKSTLSIYASLSGTNSGYEFFSPNISDLVRLDFSSKQGKLKLPINSKEGQLKLITGVGFLNGILEKEKLRNSILKSFTLRLFELDKNINDIDVEVYVNSVPELVNYIECNERTDRVVYYSFKIGRYEKISAN